MNERKDILRHFSTSLKRWAGGNAKIRELTVSHQTLTVRINKAETEGYLEIYCLGPLTINGPSYWENANININLSEKGFIVSDKSCSLIIETEGVEVKEYKKMPTNKSC